MEDEVNELWGEVDKIDEVVSAIEEAAPESLMTPSVAIIIRRIISMYGMDDLSPHIFNLVMAIQRLERAEMEKESINMKMH